MKSAVRILRGRPPPRPNNSDRLHLKLVLSLWLVDFNHTAQRKLGLLLGLVGENADAEEGRDGRRPAPPSPQLEAPLPALVKGKNLTLHIEAAGSGKVLIAGGLSVLPMSTVGAVKQQIFDLLGGGKKYRVNRQRLFLGHDALDESQELAPDSVPLKMLHDIPDQSTLVLILKPVIQITLVRRFRDDATILEEEVLPETTVEELVRKHGFFSRWFMRWARLTLVHKGSTERHYLQISTNLDKTLSEVGVQDGTTITKSDW